MFVKNGVGASLECGRFTNATLDVLVEKLWAVNVQNDREFAPKFYDYDNKRWIELKKWIPTRK